MANLVKFNLVVKDEDKRIINSNEIIREKIKELADASQYVDSNDYDDEFSGMINADSVERLLEDQTEYKNSKKEAQEILENARIEAQMMIQRSREESEALRVQGYAKGEQKGYEEGHEKAIKETEALKQELKQRYNEQEQAYQKKMEEMEPELVDALIGVFESAFSIQFSEKKDFILHLLQSSFSKIEGSKEYLIRVSKEDYPFVQEHKDELSEELPRSASVELVEDLTLTKNQCLIETDGGVFDCSLDTQMDNLIRDLRMLASM